MSISRKRLWVVAVVIVMTAAVAVLGSFMPPETSQDGAVLHAVPAPGSPIGAVGVTGWFSPDGTGGPNPCAGPGATAWQRELQRGMTDRTRTVRARGASVTVNLPLRI